MNQALEDLTFEEAFAELQAAIEELRGDGLTLDRSLSLYERGCALAVRCTTLLTTASLRISSATPDPHSSDEAQRSNVNW